MKQLFVFMALAAIILPAYAQSSEPSTEEGPQHPHRHPDPQHLLMQLERGMEEILEFDADTRDIVLDSYAQFFDDMKTLHEEAQENERPPEIRDLRELKNARDARIQEGLSDVEYAAFSTFEKMMDRHRHHRREGPEGRPPHRRGAQQGRG